MSGRFLPLLVALILFTGAGCGRDALLDERNVYYVRGMKLRDQKRPEEAAEAFRTCLRLSPKSAKAHLQLALLYAEVLDDPLRCVYHYRRFLEMRPDDPNADVVQGWLDDAEKELMNGLTARHPQWQGRPRTAAQRPGPDRPQTPRSPDREATLMSRIRELSSENLALHTKLTELKRHMQEQIAAARPAQTAAARPDDPPPETPRRSPTSDTLADAPAPGRDRQPQPRAEATSRPTGTVRGVRIHRVGKGDTLSSLSRRYYGNLKFWPQLRDYNQSVLHGRESLRMGDVLRIPPLEVLVRQRAD